MLNCPQCNLELSAADVNVSTDLALCRACDKHFKYSELVSLIQPDPQILENCPKWVQVTELFDGIEIRYRKRSAALFFLIPFTMLWSGLSMSAIYIFPLINNTLTLSGAAFGIPFLLGTIVLVSVITCLIVCGWTIRLTTGDSQVFYGVGGLGWRRRFELGNVSGVMLKKSHISQNNVPQMGVCLRMKDKTEMLFGVMFEAGSKNYVAHLVAATVMANRK